MRNPVANINAGGSFLSYVTGGFQAWKAQTLNLEKIGTKTEEDESKEFDERMKNGDFGGLPGIQISPQLFKSSKSNVNGKFGVLFLQLGGPATLDEVQPFLYNLFSDPEIIRLPEAIRKNDFVNTVHQKPLAWIISTSRAPKSKAAYASIGGGTPMIKTTDEQS